MDTIANEELLHHYLLLLLLLSQRQHGNSLLQSPPKIECSTAAVPYRLSIIIAMTIAINMTVATVCRRVSVGML